MHRSGTSAITRTLGLLGADMGPADHLGKYWENRFLRRTNQRLLGEASKDWASPPPADDGFATGAAAESELPDARRLVAAEFAGADVVVWKDPRTCLTLPFWRRVFDEDPVIVMIQRHPVEVAGSLATRNRLAPGHVFALWERYNADALRFSAGLPTIVVDYGRTLTDPLGVVGSLVETLRSWGVELPNDPATTDLELTAGSRHHETTSLDTMDHPAATESQRTMFERLRRLEGPHRALDPGPLPEPHPRSLELLAKARERQPAAPKRATRPARLG